MPGESNYSRLVSPVERFDLQFVMWCSLIPVMERVPRNIHTYELLNSFEFLGSVLVAGYFVLVMH